MLSLVISAFLLGVAAAQTGRCPLPVNNETLGRIYMTGDCNFYYKCDENGIEHTRVPCETGFVYDPVRGKCVQDTEPVDCNIGPDYYARFDQLCSNTIEGNVAMPGDSSMYVPCWRYIFRYPAMHCPAGTIFYANLGYCDHIDQENSINRQPIPADYDSYRANVGDDIIGNSVCTNKPLPGDCTKYTLCSRPNSADTYDCPENTLMSRSKGVCVYCSDLTLEEKQECQLNYCRN